MTDPSLSRSGGAAPSTGALVPLDLVFMGTPDFAVPTLAALLAAGHRLRAVYSQPPRPAGRGHKPTATPVQAYAETHGLAVRTPPSLKDPAEQAAFAALHPDAVVVVAYGLILPPPVLAVPRLGCFNLHASALPRWRGAAPIQRAIIAGDRETAIAVMRMEAGLDTGPVLAETRQPIAADTDAGTLHDTLAALGASLMVEVLQQVATGRAQERPQAAEGVTYAAKLSKEEGRLDWRQPALTLERLVRGLNPAPGAWFEHAGQRLKVRQARAVAGDGTPGHVLDDRLTIACGTGALRLEIVQRPGRAALPAEVFRRGYDLPAGTQLD